MYRNRTRARASGHQGGSAASALEPVEKKAAKERQKEHAKTAPGQAKNTSGKFPEVKKGQSRDKVAKAVGMDAKTLKKAKAVVAADLAALFRSSE